jgi:predicted dehydrogenase
MKLRVGIVGLGLFARHFVSLFVAHPGVDEVVLCDQNRERLDEGLLKYGVERGVGGYDELLASNVDAVVVFTQHWTHGPLCLQALDAGKHVFASVPPALSLDELTALVAAVERTGLTYVLGETSYYYPQAVYCRERARRGDFGDIVHVEAEYLHDWQRGYYAIMEHRIGAGWRAESGDPPFHYPTHSTAFAVSLTGARATHVSALGFEDRVEADRDIYSRDNPWANVFSNEVALLRMSDGSSARLQEFRRVGHPGTERLSVFGTEACFEDNSAGASWTTREPGSLERLDDLFVVSGGPARAHDAARLPAELHPLVTPVHGGSHAFLVDDFVRSCRTGAMPPNNVWDAARYMLPGLVGHESAVAGGTLLDIPDLGDAPQEVIPWT